MGICANSHLCWFWAMLSWFLVRGVVELKASPFSLLLKNPSWETHKEGLTLQQFHVGVILGMEIIVIDVRFCRKSCFRND